MQADIGRTTDGSISTKSATIAVTRYIGSFIDIEVGIRLLTKRIGLYQIAIQALVGIACRHIPDESRCSHRLLVEHHTAIATTVGLIYAGAIIQIHLRILRPCIFTIASSEHLCFIALFLVLKHPCMNIKLAVKGTASLVVTTIDTTRHQIAVCIYVSCQPITLHGGFLTEIVHIRLIYITRLFVCGAISTAKYTIQMNRGSLRHIHNRTTCEAFLITGTKHILEMATHQVDDRRSSNTIGIGLRNSWSQSRNRTHSCCIVTHTNTAIVTSAKHIRILIGIQILRCVNQYITAILHHVTVGITGMKEFMSLTSTIDSGYSITSIIIGLEVDKGIIHPRLIENGIAKSVKKRIATCIGISLIMSVCIVIVTIATTKDILHTSLDILGISRCLHYLRHTLLLRVIHKALDVGTHTVLESTGTKDTAPQVITAIDMVTNPRKAQITVIIRIPADISLRMT